MGVETVLVAAGLWTVVVLLAISLGAAAKRGDRRGMTPQPTRVAEPEPERAPLGRVTAARL